MYDETRYIMSEKVVFVLGDKLPTYCDSSISIYMVATKPESKKMFSTIKSYTKALINIWKGSFGDIHVTSRSSVTNKLQKIVKHYYSQVYVKVHRKSKNHKKNVKSVGKSSRQLNKSWRTMLLPWTIKYHSVRYFYVKVTAANDFLQ